VRDYRSHQRNKCWWESPGFSRREEVKILAPGWSWSKRIIGSPLIVLAPLTVYFAVVARIFPQFAAEMLNPDLAGVQAVVATPTGTALVWAHLIAFDLFIGRWMYLDSRERRVHGLVMAPILVLTILLSPFGLVLYLLIRQFRPAPHRTR
jgi:ABA DEFICIENT 4-like